MSSFLTSSIESKQINSVDDVYRSGIPIAVPDFTKGLVEFQKYPKLINQSLDFEIDNFTKLRNFFNTNYIYPIATDVWEFLNLKQSLRKRPIFRLTEFSLGTYFGCLPLSNNSILEEPLNTFILQSKDAGLDKYWLRESFRIALQSKYIEISREFSENRPFGMQYFYGIFGLLVSSWILGVFVVYLEKLCHKFNQ